MWRTGSECKSERTGVMWQNRGFCATTRARVFWTRWRRDRFEMDVPARRELQYSSWEPTIAAAVVLEASVEREALMWRRARIWKNRPYMFQTLAYQRHFWVEVNTQIFNWCLKLNRRASNRDCSNRLSQSSKRFGSGVVKGDGLWLGWVQMKTIIQKPVMDSRECRIQLKQSE